VNRYHILAIGLPCLAACGTGPEDFARCQATLDISVSPDVVPVISWTPAGCPVNLLTVDDGPNPVWSLYNQEPVNAIESPVQYGRAAGQGEVASPGPPPGGSTLVSGVRYVVRLQRIEHGLVTDAGEAPFDYQPPAADRGARSHPTRVPSDLQQLQEDPRSGGPVDADRIVFSGPHRRPVQPRPLPAMHPEVLPGPQLKPYPTRPNRV